jgi:hypothetical protein
MPRQPAGPWPWPWRRPGAPAVGPGRGSSTTPGQELMPGGGPLRDRHGIPVRMCPGSETAVPHISSVKAAGASGLTLGSCIPVADGQKRSLVSACRA